MYSVATNACHSTDTLVYVYAAAATITNSLGFVCSLNREKRMMWLNCTILYADIGLSNDDDKDDDDDDEVDDGGGDGGSDEGGSGNTFPISHREPHLPYCVRLFRNNNTQVHGVEIGRLFCYTPRYI